jgi:NAD(P)-dependent dehydrogenase (short-subunit alcohol dehydrogenase family)
MSPGAAPVVIITGASGGIGAGLVAAFRGSGYAVVATSLSIGPSDDPDTLTVQGDITEIGAAQRVVEQAVDRFGRVDTLINNAGIFSLTKGGLAAVTRSLAIEYASRCVRVNAVSPGAVRTPIHDPASYAGIAAVHPLGRVGEVSDVADAILYLERATIVTGEILHVDGRNDAMLASGHCLPLHNAILKSFCCFTANSAVK